MDIKNEHENYEEMLHAYEEVNVYAEMMEGSITIMKNKIRDRLKELVINKKHDEINAMRKALRNMKECMSIVLEETSSSTESELNGLIGEAAQASGIISLLSAMKLEAKEEE